MGKILELVKSNNLNTFKYHREKPQQEAVAKFSVEKVFFEISQNSQENTYVRVSFLIKLQVSKKETLAQMFSCEFCEISKNTFS